MASADSIMAPRSDSSAWRSWGGTRPAAARRGAPSSSSRAAIWPLPSFGSPVQNERTTLGISRSFVWRSCGRLGDDPAPRARLGGDDLDGDGELDLGVELGRHQVGAEGLDRLVEVQLAAI